MFGKTIFSRVLFTNLSTVLIGIIILASLQMVLMSNYISKQNESTLAKNAESIVSLINNGISQENLNSVLNGFSRSSSSHIIITDVDGRVIVNTTESGYWANESRESLELDHLREVLSGKRVTVVGTMNGAFNETMFTLEVPVIRGENKAVYGAVLVSTPIPQRRSMLFELFKILLFSALVVIVVSFILSYMLSRILANPIKRVGKSASDFAGGDLTSRVAIDRVDENVTEITELADAFNNMADELEKSEDIRMSFISDVSHELRTPMTTIGGFIDGILDDTIPPEKQKEYLSIVKDEVTRLSRLVNTFLDITRMQSDKVNIVKSDFDINEVIRLIIIGLGPKIDKKNLNIDLVFDNDVCYVRADADKIKMVITNLIDNAIKFTYDRGTITITTCPKGSEVFISVHNTGVGIPEEQQKIIFERLYKVDKSRSINKEGTGIGLYIVKSMLSAHGKDIKVKSVEGEYAEFSFYLDRGKPTVKGGGKPILPDNKIK